MTFLSKLGSLLAKGLALATGVWPLVSGLFGSSAKAQQAQQTGNTVINDLTQIGQIVVQAEALIQAPGSGAQKLAAATPLVVNIVKTSELVSGHKIANETLFIQGCTDLTSAIAEVLNSLSPDSVNTASGSPTPAIPAPTKQTPPAGITPSSAPSAPSAPSA